MRNVDSAYRRSLANRRRTVDWDVRLTTKDGKVYPLTQAVTNRSRKAGGLNGGSWSLELDLDRDLLPKGVLPQQFEDIIVDRLVEGGRYRYFTGQVDVPKGGDSLQEGGDIDRPLSLECFGVLQKAKGYRASAINLNPAMSGGFFQMTALCSTIRYQPMTTMSPGASERLPNGVTMGVNQGALMIFSDPSMTLPYTKGTSTSGDYYLDTTVVPAKITWRITPATTRVIEFAQLERFVILKRPSGYLPPRYIQMPVGRRFDDLFHTWVTNVSGNQLTLADKTGWADKFMMTPLEWCTVITADGTETQLVIQNVDAATGVVTIDTEYGPALPAGLAEGDAIRLSTTEYWPAWDSNWLAVHYTNAGITEWNRRYFSPMPNQGWSIPQTPRNWTTTEDVYVGTRTVGRTDGNRVENMMKAILEATVYPAGTVTVGKSGAFIKNYRRAAITLEEFVAEMKDGALPPNVHTHDTPEGGITIKPYIQKDTPDWEILGADDIQEVEVPEPVTAFTMLGMQTEQEPPTNVASQWFLESFQMNFPERTVDNNATSEATPTVSTSQMYAAFRVPRITPRQTHPVISGVRITGKGLLTVYSRRPNGSTYYLDGYMFRMIGANSGSTVEIPGEELTKILQAPGDIYQDLVFRFDPITTGDTLSTVTVETAAAVAEIEILTRQAGAWRASLIDDAGHSLNLDGTNDYVEVPHNAAHNAYPLTVECWVKTTAGDLVQRGLVSKFDSAGMNGWAIYLYNGSIGGGYLRGSGVTNYVDFSATLGGGVVNDGKWHHIVMVIDSTGGKFYTDGRLVSSVGWVGTPGACTTTQPLRIGRYNSAGGYLSGDVADVRVWSSGRQSYDIERYKSERLRGTESGLVACYPLNETSGTTATDRTSNARHGTLYNGASFTVTGDRRLPWAPANRGLTNHGTIWRQTDTGDRESYRYAPPELLRRLSVLYWFPGSLEPRHDVRPMTGISQQDCRDYAERWQDENVRLGKTYQVRAIFRDEAELGDTVRLWRDDYYVDCLLVDMDDDGPLDAEEDLATYVLADYSR